jgi:meso-butanediol dehydrogenase / (S,S)-butanediol dehydrogenase / diacetyl reductase
MDGRFEGRAVVVTGAGQGIGRAIAAAFASEGARVVLAGRNEQRVRDAAKELGPHASAVRCDVANASDVEALIDTGIARLGQIDILVNNAGTITMATVVDLTEDEWDLVMDVNAKGVFLCTRAVLSHMLDRRSGVIVNISSGAGKRGYKLFAHYCASKAAVIGFTRAVALEVAPHVRVNCICPGVTNTNMLESEYAWETEMTGEPKEAIQRRWLSSIPMGTFLEPDDIARPTLFIASDDASEMTGQAINVTGGMLME